MLEYFLECARISVICFVVTNIFFKSGHILGWYIDILDDIYRKNKWYSIIANPLGYCELCFTGQVALWYYLIYYGINFNILTFVSIVLIILLQLQKHFRDA